MFFFMSVIIKITSIPTLCTPISDNQRVIKKSFFFLYKDVSWDVVEIYIRSVSDTKDEQYSLIVLVKSLFITHKCF